MRKHVPEVLKIISYLISDLLHLSKRLYTKMYKCPYLERSIALKRKSPILSIFMQHYTMLYILYTVYQNKAILYVQKLNYYCQHKTTEH